MDDVAKLKARVKHLESYLKAIRDYPPNGRRRTKDGYPAEVAYDEYAYKRIVDTYRVAARAGLKAK